MEQRPLGSQGLRSSPQGLGCMGMTGFYGDFDRQEQEERSLETIGKALELGINMFDTAWIYQSFGQGGGGNFTNEELLAKAIRRFGREKFVIATKFGVLPTPSGPACDSSEGRIRSQLADSLARLGIDCIDLYYQHRPDPNTPMEDVMRVLKSLVEEGKIKHVGLSECSVEDLRRAHAVYPVSALQMEYSLQTRDIETNGILAAARELGVAIVAYSPLGRGFLTAAYTSKDKLDAGDWRRSNPRWSDENFEKNANQHHFFDIAHRKGCTPAQLALAWVHAQGNDIFPIPGTKSPSRLAENAAAVAIAASLTPQDIAEISASVEQGSGERYAGQPKPKRDEM